MCGCCGRLLCASPLLHPRTWTPATKITGHADVGALLCGACGEQPQLHYIRTEDLQQHGGWGTHPHAPNGALRTPDITAWLTRTRHGYGRSRQAPIMGGCMHVPNTHTPQHHGGADTPAGATQWCSTARTHPCQPPSRPCDDLLFVQGVVSPTAMKPVCGVRSSFCLSARACNTPPFQSFLCTHRAGDAYLRLGPLNGGTRNHAIACTSMLLCFEFGRSCPVALHAPDKPGLQVKDSCVAGGQCDYEINGLVPFFLK